MAIRMFETIMMMVVMKNGYDDDDIDDANDGNHFSRTFKAYGWMIPSCIFY